MQEYELLEKEIAEWCGAPWKPENIVACSSGSAALHLATEVARDYIPKAFHKVDVPAFAMIACSRAVTLASLQPDFVDCRDDLNGNFGNADTRIVVHTYGRQARFFISVNEHVIDDLAEAHGVKPKHRLGASCWSFYKNKIVAGEEGGAVAFAYPSDANKARRLRSHGFTEDHDFRHIPRGMNYRLSNVHASLIRRSLANVNENLKKRAEICATYDHLIPDEIRMPPRDVCWVYDVRIKGMTHDVQRPIVKALNARGVAARCGFYPLNKQPEYINLGFQCPNAELAAQEVIYLPITPEMTSDDVKRNVLALIDLAPEF